jgi:hypothetical protein
LEISELISHRVLAFRDVALEVGVRILTQARGDVVLNFILIPVELGFTTLLVSTRERARVKENLLHFITSRI